MKIQIQVPSAAVLDPGTPGTPTTSLKKLNWRKQMLNQASLARCGGAIWQDLPKVEVPKETFSHLFAQRGLEPLKKKTVRRYAGRYFIPSGWMSRCMR